ncbi:MAG: VanZ family protein [Parvularculaceae bacterium]
MRHAFLIFYCCLAPLLLTLNPFQFQTQIGGWEAEIQLKDIAQNILLFLPVGAAIWLVTKRGIISVFAAGFALSLLIETLQLFLIGRNSSLIDLGANSLGALAGGFLAMRLVQSARDEDLLGLSFMILPAAWIIALRVLNNPNHGVLMVPLCVALVALLTIGLTNTRVAITIGYCGLLIIALAVMSPLGAGLAIGATGLSIWAMPKFTQTNQARALVVALGLTVLGVVAASGIWNIGDAPRPWRVSTNLRWMELLFVLVPFMSAAKWLRQNVS